MMVSAKTFAWYFHVFINICTILLPCTDDYKENKLSELKVGKISRENKKNLQVDGKELY